MQYHTKPCNTIKYHKIPCYIIWCNAYELGSARIDVAHGTLSTQKKDSFFVACHHGNNNFGWHLKKWILGQITAFCAPKRTLSNRQISPKNISTKTAFFLFLMLWNYKISLFLLFLKETLGVNYPRIYFLIEALFSDDWQSHVCPQLVSLYFEHQNKAQDSNFQAMSLGKSDFWDSPAEDHFQVNTPENWMHVISSQSSLCGEVRVIILKI